VEGLGFYFIPVVENPKANVEGKAAVVRVLEGSFTVDQLAVELEKLLPDKKHKWEIETKGTDAFIINFPSSDLLETMVNWGPMDAKAVKSKIRFEKGTENEVYKYSIDKVWVLFRGLPKEFREFPIIWAVGTILGVPRAVDTIFTLNTGRARMKVAVLDLSSSWILWMWSLVTLFTSYSLEWRRTLLLMSHNSLIWTLPRRVILKRKTPRRETRGREIPKKGILREKWMLMEK